MSCWGGGRGTSFETRTAKNVKFANKAWDAQGASPRSPLIEWRLRMIQFCSCDVENVSHDKINKRILERLPGLNVDQKHCFEYNTYNTKANLSLATRLHSHWKRRTRLCFCISGQPTPSLCQPAPSCQPTPSLCQAQPEKTIRRLPSIKSSTARVNSCHNLCCEVAKHREPVDKGASTLVIVSTHNGQVLVPSLNTVAFSVVPGSLRVLRQRLKEKKSSVTREVATSSLRVTCSSVSTEMV